MLHLRSLLIRRDNIMTKTNADIISVAHLIGILIKGSIGSDEIQARCPFCNDTKFHLYMNTRANVYYCQRCKASSDAVGLYMYYFNLSRSQAIDDLLLNSVELWKEECMGGCNYRYDIVNGNSRKYKIQPCKGKEIRPLLYRHKVYNSLLDLCPLYPEHKISLLERGFSTEAITYYGYKSVPLGEKRNRIVETLAQKYDLDGIPGFYIDKGKWKMCANRGFFIPVRDSQRLIQSLQIRHDSGSRYSTFSSSRFSSGYKCPSFIHVTGNINSDVISITEGPLKSDLSSFLGNYDLFIAPCGIGSIKYLEDTLKILCPPNSKKIIVDRTDMDKYTNKWVMIKQKEIIDVASKYGIVTQENWPACINGIDDWRLVEQMLSKAA